MMNNTAASYQVGWRSVSSDSRGTLSLLYSCILTLWICSWSAVHLNLPADSDGELKILARKFLWMGATILAPDFVTTNSWHDWKEARYWLKKLKEMHREKKLKVEVGSLWVTWA